jgi:hypothetical protein
MSVAIAVTVTLPNSTAALVTATGTDIAQSIGPEVTRLVTAQFKDGKNVNVVGASVAATVT